MHSLNFIPWAKLLKFNALAVVALSTIHAQDISPIQALTEKYCLECHNPEKKKGKLDLESIYLDEPTNHPDVWEEVLWMLRDREMPPTDEPDLERPSESEYESVSLHLEQTLGVTTTSASFTLDDLGKVPHRAVVEEFCLSCHNDDDREGELSLDGLLEHDITAHPEIWENAIRKMRARQMPPVGKKRPDEAIYDRVIAALESPLDHRAAEEPHPGRTETFRRLNRTEYKNAIRDLLGLEIDANALLPKDDPSHGFDNVTVSTLSPSLLDRYLTAAKKISRLAIGSPLPAPAGHTVRVAPDLTQEQHMPGLPVGSRGGTVIPYTFPRDGEYEFQVRLARDRDEHVEGLNGTYQMEVLIDGDLIEQFELKRQKTLDGFHSDHSKVDEHCKVRLKVDAGSHDIGVTFIKKSNSLIETERKPYEAHYNRHRHPRLTPAVYQVSITGPYEATSAGDTPYRDKVFVDYPSSPRNEIASAKKILRPLMRKAFRRPITAKDLEKPMEFFRLARKESGFEAGIELALSSVLVSPQFLFRIEKAPAKAATGDVYAISDLELASRLSFFIWSSLPDEELLDLADAQQLSDPETLEAQVQRMLADPRSENFVTNFANQWLYLRNLDSITPDLRLYPDFDDNLRQAFRRETELLFADVLREDRSILDLLKSDYTYLNERLATHYGIPNVYGSRFRKVPLDEDAMRGGILRHGSVLTVTSYATRTSPVIRGNWILENIVGTPPPPPPPNIPALEDNTVDASLPMRARLSVHRENKACAVCHDTMDPIGFSLENYDAIGQWRDLEGGIPVDASGSLPDGNLFHDVVGLENGLLERPELFASTLTEKLLTFALGRGVDYTDAPAIRTIVRNAEANDYAFSSLILGIVNSTPFKMRTAQ